MIRQQLKTFLPFVVSLSSHEQAALIRSLTLGPFDKLRTNGRFLEASIYADRHLARRSGQKWLKIPVLAGVLIFILILQGCGSAPKKTDGASKPAAASGSNASSAKSGGYYLDDGPGANPPANLDAIPDAVPRTEPLHRGANRPYVVFGKTYVPNVAANSLTQKGIASWYGRKFHGQKTSIGETYDMYAMTAAHPTLPLPSYVRVTNPANNKSVVVRVNDRGPFHSERIIDLSFAAANRLDIARRGSGMVVIERVFADGRPTSPIVVATPVPPASIPAPPIPTNIAAASPITTEDADAGSLFLQLGAFSSMENAEIFRARMTRELDWNREPILVSQKDGLFRVRLGPYKSREEAEAIQAQVKASHDFSPLISKP